MKVPEIIKRLEKFLRLVTAAAIGLSIVEALIVLFIGIAASNIATPSAEINNIWIKILITLVIVYSFIIIVKILYNANYPSSITNELKAQTELDLLRHQAERQKIISDFVVETIERLNGATCALNPGNDAHLCDQGVQNGINELIKPVIDNVYFLLSTLNTQFTVGLYLGDYKTLGNPDNDHWDKGIITLKDSLLLVENGIDKTLLQTENLNGAALDIQTAIRKSLYNQEFIKEDFRIDSNELTIICSPMPFACDEDNLLGVLFIVTKILKTVPPDLQTSLSIFNRVISNWVFRYNQCINTRLDIIGNPQQQQQ